MVMVCIEDTMALAIATTEDTGDVREGLPSLLLSLLLTPRLIPIICIVMALAMATMGDTMDTPMEDTTMESKKDLECQKHNDDLPNVLSQFLKMYKIKNT